MAPKPNTTMNNRRMSTPSAEIIGRIGSLIEFDYRVTNVQYEGGLVHLTLAPISDPDRNRLRELYADRTTYELTKLVATDTLFISGPMHDEFAALFTMTMGVVNGVPVVTHIHGTIGANRAGQEYEDDGKVVDFSFTDITFPPQLPEWYFNPREYGAHTNDVPE